MDVGINGFTYTCLLGIYFLFIVTPVPSAVPPGGGGKPLVYGALVYFYIMYTRILYTRVIANFYYIDFAHTRSTSLAGIGFFFSL